MRDMKLPKKTFRQILINEKKRIRRKPRNWKNIFKKPSNRSRLEDDLMEKKVLAYLKNFTKIKEVKVNTKDLRKQSEGNVQS